MTAAIIGGALAAVVLLRWQWAEHQLRQQARRIALLEKSKEQDESWINYWRARSNHPSLRRIK